jgi:uncharacterized protein (TIRG00374 family)
MKQRIYGHLKLSKSFWGLNMKKIGKLIKNGGLFIILIVITFYFVFRNIELKESIDTIRKINVKYLLLAIFSMFLFILCESLNTKRNILALGYDIKFLKCIKYSFYGFFFSSITPSASGGQPMQAYCMCKDKIKISHATLVLCIELVFFQIVAILFSIVGFFNQYSILKESVSSVKYLIFLGFIMNVLILLFLITTMFSYTTIKKEVDFFIKILKFFNVKKATDIQEKLYSIIEEYRECSLYIIKNKSVIIKTFITTCFQIFFKHSVPFWVYRAFGFDYYSIITFILIESVLFIAVSSLPLPGAVGASESGFLMIYKILFNESVLKEAMLLSRGISFYLFVFITGLFVLIDNIIKYRKSV